MTRKIRIFTILSAMLLCSVSLAQAPVVNIDKKLHGNLYEAQRLVAQADHYILEAQKDNRYDMKGHATNARRLLVQANEELKAAAETANASAKH